MGDEANLAVKFLDEEAGLIEGLAIPFGGPAPGGKDLDGDYFTKDTDLCLEWYPEGRPILYSHALDPKMETAVIGRQFKAETRDEGVWVQAQLNRAHSYWKLIAGLVKKGALSFSSGAWPQTVVKGADGHIKRWAWGELSLTPVPANPYALVASKSFDSLRALGLPLKATFTDEVFERFVRAEEQVGDLTRELENVRAGDFPAFVRLADRVYELSGQVHEVRESRGIKSQTEGEQPGAETPAEQTTAAGEQTQEPSAGGETPPDPEGQDAEAQAAKHAALVDAETALYLSQVRA